MCMRQAVLKDLILYVKHNKNELDFRKLNSNNLPRKQHFSEHLNTGNVEHHFDYSKILN